MPPVLVATYTVLVNPKSMPWSVPLNPAYSYGLNDGTAPTFVTSVLVAGQIVTVTATGTVKPSDSRPLAGPDGTPPATGSTGGSTGTGFPTRYMPGSLLGLAGLCGMFSKNFGRIVQALSLGSSASLIVPVGGNELYLGVNDDHYSDNTSIGYSATIKVYNPALPERTTISYFDFGA